MTKRLNILIALFAMLAFSAAASFADPVLQFQSNLGHTGGSMTLADSGGLPQFTITDAPIDGVFYVNTSTVYTITGGLFNLTCLGTTSLCGTTDTFSITGSVTIGANPPVTGVLVSGALQAGPDTSLDCYAGSNLVGSYSFDPSAPHGVLDNNGSACSGATELQAHGSGPDFKNTTMLADLGIPTGELWQFKGFSIGVNNSGGSPWVVTSTTFTDNGIGVPEPSSLLLMGSGLLGFVGLGLRKKTAKS